MPGGFYPEGMADNETPRISIWVGDRPVVTVGMAAGLRDVEVAWLQRHLMCPSCGLPPAAWLDGSVPLYDWEQMRQFFNLLQNPPHPHEGNVVRRVKRMPVSQVPGAEGGRKTTPAVPGLSPMGTTWSPGDRRDDGDDSVGPPEINPYDPSP